MAELSWELRKELEKIRDIEQRLFIVQKALKKARIDIEIEAAKVEG